MSYKLKLEVFEGPLDLLLYLIKKDELDICNISIAQVADQYMEYIDMMQLLDLNIVGDFLVMAATLMHIKSQSLLPADPLNQDENPPDPADELVARLLEYKKFKEIAEELKNKESQRQDLFARNIDEAAVNELKEDSKEVFIEASLFDLINALSKALARVPEGNVYEVVKEEYTVDKKIHTILHLLMDQPRISLIELFKKAESKLEVIVIFLAVLELIRLREVVVMQRRLFDDIEVVRNKDHEVAPSHELRKEDDGGTQAVSPQPGNG